MLLQKALDDATATRLAGENPDYGTQSLFEAIESGNYPSWTVYIVSSALASQLNDILMTHYYSKP